MIFSSVFRKWQTLVAAVAVAIPLASFISVRSGAAQTPVEIVELARALKFDPDLIYEYVHNNIETLPQYGSLKGPFGALLDGKGTAFDQAELMVALLQQAGIPASFQIGAIQLTTSQLTQWLGTDAQFASLSATLADGGFSGCIIAGGVCVTTDNGQPVTGAVIGWAWVSASIGGTNFVFDPATKVYNRSAGLGFTAIANAMGYSRGTFINRAESGMTTQMTPQGGVFGVTNPNRANVRSDLAAFATSLVQFLRTNNAAASTIDIIGGKTIPPLALGTRLRQASLSYAVGTPQTQPTIPSTFRTKLSLTLGTGQGGSFSPLAPQVTWLSSDIYGHRIAVSFSSTAVPSLLIDGVTQVIGSSGVPSGQRLTIRTSIMHPYADPFANVTNNDSMLVAPLNVVYLIETGWGVVGRGMIEKHRRLLQQNIAQNPNNPTAEAVLGESLAMIGYTWLAEVSQNIALIEQTAGVDIPYHHAVGIVGIKQTGSISGPFVDLPTNPVSPVQTTNHPASPASTPIEAAAFFSVVGEASVAESGTLEQTQPNATAASTVKLIDATVQNGGQVFDINHPNSAGDDVNFYTNTIRPTLVSNYLSGDLRRVDSLVNQQNLRVVAPANGKINVNAFQGAGFFQIAQDGSEIGAIITGGLSGGIPASDVATPVVPENTSITVTPSSQTDTITTPIDSGGNGGANAGQVQLTGEPINLVTGDYFNSVTDLTVGSQAMPYGLAFQRYYDSGTRLVSGPLGLGWTHNFAITALTNSDAFEGMGINSPINGAAAIAATLVTFDILNLADGSKPLDRIVIASLVQRWLMDQLTNNIVAVTQPGYIEHFTKLADGSFNPPLGSATALSFNGAFNYRTKNGVTLAFDANGNLSTWSNAAGATLSLAYSSGSPATLASVTTALGHKLTFAYAAGPPSQPNQLTQVSDGARVVTYSYDSAGNLIRCVDAAGNPTGYVYDQPGRLTQNFLPATPTIPFVTNTYDSLGRVRAQANANNTLANNTTWQYFLAGSRSEEVDPFGTRHVIYTTPRGKTRVEIQDASGLNRVTTTGYDGLDRATLTTLPEGNSVGSTYDANSNVLSVTATAKPGSPLTPRVQSFTYEPVFNQVTTATDPRGLVATFGYDGNGNLVRSVQDAGAAPHLNATRTFSYSGIGQVLTATDPLGATTAFSYDAPGNVIAVARDVGVGHLNQTTGVAYNAVGDVVAVTDPNGNVTALTYDAMRRLTSVTTPGVALTTATSYDANGRPFQVQQSSSGQVLRMTSATYSPTGKPLTATDALGNVTSFAYDLLDRTSSVTDAVGRVSKLTYDALGRPASAFNLAIQAAPIETHAYTPNGREGSVTDARGNVTAYGYDGFDRLASATYAAGTALASSESFSYDPDNNLTQRLTRRGDAIVFTYDTLNRLVAKAPPAPTPTVNYTYDLMGRLTAVNDNGAAIAGVVPPTPPVTRYTTSYSYDARNRLVGASFDSVNAPVAPAPASVRFDYAYNAANQRTLQQVSDDTYLNRPSGPGAVSYAVNALNQYTAVGAVTPSYDANGNLTFDGSFTYGYDAESRLVSASGAGTTASYGYDGLGRRKTKTVNGATTVFVSDGDQEVLDYDGASGQVLRRHVYGSGIDQPLNRIDVSGARVALISDVQGSIVASLDAATGTVTKTPYQTFGESADASGSYRYTGRRIDAETNGLYYYRARMYSPALGRFLQPDPIGYAGGANLYAYVGNDPLNRTDPSGEFINFVIGGAIGFGIDLAAQYAEARIAGRDFHIDVTRSLIATGVGVATSGASAFVSSGAEIGASAVAQAVGSSFARRVVSNAVIGAAGNVGQTAALNNLDGKNGSYAESAALGAVFGAAGSVAGDLISGVGSVAGAVPGRGVSVGQANLINNIANTSGALLTTVSPAAVTAGTAFGAAVGNLSGFSDAGHEAAGSHGK